MRYDAIVFVAKMCVIAPFIAQYEFNVIVFTAIILCVEKVRCLNKKCCTGLLTKARCFAEPLCYFSLCTNNYLYGMIRLTF